eukprot:gnl/Chilomastix_cuspidata/880.p1 GENE.gnl/Chilomastix_cuspidata/880~~gnl/Chilomastix_cuspidata/880.p1  ORF type:complete len:193 (+),score=46.66 gnl/Chilomastix_cuspidata/880:32-580(+)
MIVFVLRKSVVESQSLLASAWRTILIEFIIFVVLSVLGTAGIFMWFSQFSFAFFLFPFFTFFARVMNFKHLPKLHSGKAITLLVFHVAALVFLFVLTAMYLIFFLGIIGSIFLLLLGAALLSFVVDLVYYILALVFISRFASAVKASPVDDAELSSSRTPLVSHEGHASSSAADSSATGPSD